jgi:hypothetical protein
MGTTVVTGLFDQPRHIVTTRDSSVRTTSRLCAGKLGSLCLIPDRSDASTTAVELNQPPLCNGRRGICPLKDEKSGLNLTTNLNSAVGVKNVWPYVSAQLIRLYGVVQVEKFTASSTPPCQKAIVKLKILNPSSCEFLCMYKLFGLG